MADQKEMLTLADVEEARKRIGNAVKVTPLVRCDVFSKQLPDTNLYLKLETLQRTGAFKERGACNKLRGLSDEEKKKGVVAASAGNHAQGVAYHSSLLGVNATIYMPQTTPLIKVNNTRNYGANVVLFGTSFDDASAEAQRVVKEEGKVFVHPFDDFEVMAGQGTIGLELLEQNPDLDTIIVPIGGGGLISGIACAVKEKKPSIKVIGVQPDVLPSMKVAMEQHKPVLIPAAKTLADGLSVRLTGSKTLKVCEKYVDEVVTVTEAEIAAAVLVLLEKEKIVCEGAGAAGIAAVVNKKCKIGKEVACVVGGGNIDVTVLERIIEMGLVESGRRARFSITVPDVPGSMAELTKLLADNKANIVDINHNRGFTDRLNFINVEVTVETRGKEHIEELLKALNDNGFKSTKY